MDGKIIFDVMFDDTISKKSSLEIADNTGTGAAHGASDARFLSDYGIKGIVWGADGDMSQHALDEHVNIDSILELYTILDEFMKNIP